MFTSSAIVFAAVAPLVAVYAQAQPPATAPTVHGIVSIPRLKMQVRDFVVVSEVIPGSPADKAGLKTKDIIVGVENKLTTTATAYVETTKAMPPNAILHLKVQRGRMLMDCTITMDAWESSNTLPLEKRGRTGTALRNYLIVQKVDADAGARRMGIGVGDEILIGANKNVVTAADLAQAVMALPADQPVLILFKRGRETFASQLLPDGTASYIAQDRVYANAVQLKAGSATPLSGLVDMARKDVDIFRRQSTGKKLVLAGLISQVFARKDGVDVLMDASGNHSSGNADTVWIKAKTGPLADQLRGLKAGQILYVSALLNRVTTETVDKPFDVNGSESLDRRPGDPPAPPKKVTAVKLYLDVDAVL